MLMKQLPEQSSKDSTTTITSCPNPHPRQTDHSHLEDILSRSPINYNLIVGSTVMRAWDKVVVQEQGDIIIREARLVAAPSQMNKKLHPMMNAHKQRLKHRHTTRIQTDRRKIIHQLSIRIRVQLLQP